ncbi:MAG TPA: hypothetical protein PLD62_02830, partial [Candidatus Cloacimonadota bacterium]|nr:hypothetical protein [Candidatus Cloacimonadota bacterium]
ESGNLPTCDGEVIRRRKNNVKGTSERQEDLEKVTTGGAHSLNPFQWFVKWKAGIFQLVTAK